MPQRKREAKAMRVIPRFVYNPEKAGRGLKAMADILAGAIRKSDRSQHEDEAPPVAE